MILLCYPLCSVFIKYAVLFLGRQFQLGNAWVNCQTSQATADNYRRTLLALFRNLAFCLAIASDTKLCFYFKSEEPVHPPLLLICRPSILAFYIIPVILIRSIFIAT